MNKKPNKYLSFIVIFLFCVSMGGGIAAAVVLPPTTTGKNHHSPSLFSSTVSHVSSNFNTESSVFVDEGEIRTDGYSTQTNIGSVPSQTEVQHAISDLRRVMNGLCATNSGLSGVEQMMEHCSQDSSGIMMVKSLGQKRLNDAYHLLQTDTSVQKLVLSISSDTKVWHSILRNDAVQDIRSSLSNKAIEEKGMTYEKELDSTSCIVKGIFTIMKSKIIDFVEKLECLVFETLQCVSKTKTSTSRVDDLLEEKVRSSLLLSVVILMIVVVTRSIDT